MKRRTFLKHSAGASTAISMMGLGMWSCTSDSKSDQSTGSEMVEADEAKQGVFPIGIQLYTLATVLSDDFSGTLKMLSETGYKKLEFAGPYYFSPQSEIDNNILIQQMGLKGYGYYSNSPAELKSLLDDLDLSAPSAHISMDSIDHNLDEILNAANIIGHEYITIPMMIHPDLDGWKASADKFNEIGEACKSAGVGFAYHNHSQEYAEMDGEVIMDVLLQRTDPDLVSFEMDLFWTEVAGVKPQDYFDKYPGRFKMLHIKDMDEPMKTPNTDWQVFTNAEEAMKFMGKQTVIGEGSIDFKTIVSEAQNSGMQHLFIESDFPPEPIPFSQKSFKNLDGMINKG